MYDYFKISFIITYCRLISFSFHSENQTRKIENDVEIYERFVPSPDGRKRVVGKKNVSAHYTQPDHSTI